MNLRTLICPYDPELINGLSNREIGVRVDSASLVSRAAEMVRNSGNRLLCVILDSTQPVEAVPWEDAWKGIPILLTAPAAGEFRKLVHKLPLLKTLNLKIYLSATDENIRDARILSSLGVSCVLRIEAGAVDWEALTDLMTYALCARAPHAPIDPFDYIARKYDAREHLKWGGVYLEDAEKYFHLDKEKNVALSAKEALARQFIGRLDEIEKAEPEEIAQRADAWSRNFTGNSPCATCEGFKICMGSFRPEDGKTEGCKAFFSETIETLGELYAQKDRAGKERVWQL
ncbi:MAG: hypothetical protein ABSD72_05215 [Terracidiphilus sp.]